MDYLSRLRHPDSTLPTVGQNRMTFSVTTSSTQDQLTHLDAQGRAHMVDVAAKDITLRKAQAGATIRMKPETFVHLCSGTSKKGDVFAAARIAGIQASKRTPELIPLCHQIALTSCAIAFDLHEETSEVGVRATTCATDRTGVEMEAMMAVTIAALTLYDMLKAIDRGMEITKVHLLQKSGGKSGEFRST